MVFSGYSGFLHPRNPRWSSVTGEDWDAPRISHTCGDSLKNSPKKKGVMCTDCRDKFN
jgi:hypothetical protein